MGCANERRCDIVNWESGTGARGDNGDGTGKENNDVSYAYHIVGYQSTTNSGYVWPLKVNSCLILRLENGMNLFVCCFQYYHP